MGLSPATKSQLVNYSAIPLLGFVNLAFKGVLNASTFLLFGVPYSILTTVMFFLNYTAQDPDLKKMHKWDVRSSIGDLNLGILISSLLSIVGVYDLLQNAIEKMVNLV